ncbi:MAG TPA: bifunctional 2-polyprenyl-6-hydroxyphenol methylase/3-demethylubiquinol 3-O-methyltransferase UbiG [Thiotrichales bacterium]|nr:bifunctional 2-polyprenyl-6-hydroxyphenol methylase/3-demethylubiquinol 3-O-methyltransferase UbiG [Thiotrichales bacterium]
MTAVNEQNVDHREVEKFEQLASRWWDPESEFKPLHDINPLRLGYIERLAGGLEGKEVVDVGCGGGILAESMATRGAKVLGIDLGKAPLAVARLHSKESGAEVEYRHMSVEELAEESPGRFDVVTCMEMLEHVPDPASVVEACARLLKPEGHLFLSTINRNPKSWLFAIVGAEYLLRLLPRGTHDFQRFIRPSELDRWLRATGMAVDDVTGMTYNPLTRSYHLGRDIDVNYLMHARPAGSP